MRSVSLVANSPSAAKREGHAGTTGFSFRLELDGPAAATETVGWSVVGSGPGTATASDFPGGSLPSGTVTFAPGEAERIFVVEIAGDAIVEADEGFAVVLSNPSAGLDIATAMAVVSIRNDDLTAHRDSYVILEGGEIVVGASTGLLANDEAVSPLTAGLVAAPLHGVLQLSPDGSLQYRPDDGFTGIDRFTYRATDSDGTMDEAEVRLHVVPVDVGANTTLDLLRLTAEEQIAAIYVAFFGRAADAGGLDFWVQEFTAGALHLQPAELFVGIASSFATSSEARALYPFLVDPAAASEAQMEAFLGTVYDNLFNRQPDSGGLAYWTARVQAAIASGEHVGSVLIDIIGGAQDSLAGLDVTTLMSKVAVSLSYVEEQQEWGTAWTLADDLAEAVALLDGVGADPASVLDGMAEAQALVAADAAAGANQPAIISGTTSGQVTEKGGVLNGSAGVATAEGDLDAVDPDSPSTFLVQIGQLTDHGRFTIDAQGKWAYTLDDTDTAVQGLASGDTLTEHVTVRTVDGTTQVVSITVQGADDAAILSSGSAALMETNAVLSTGGILTISDVDSAASFLAQAGVAGAYGMFKIDASGAWSYMASSAHDAFVGGTVYRDTFDVSSADGTRTSVTIEIAGTNDAAVLPAGLATLQESDAALTTGGTLTASDVDGAASFVAQAGTVGLYGAFKIDASGAWSYTASSAHDAFVAGTVYRDTFGVSSADGTTSSVTIEITGSNDAALLSAAVATLSETNAALTTGGTLTIADVDSAATFVPQAATVGLHGTFKIDASGTWSYSASSAHDAFVASVTYTDTFGVTSADGTATSVTIRILGTNDAAVLSAVTATLTESNAVLTANGTVAISDVDSPATFVAQAGTAGAYGTFNIDPSGAWSYTTGSAHDGFVGGETYTDSFSVISLDGTTTSVTIRILGTDDLSAPIAEVVTLTETNAALMAGGRLSVHDADGPAAFVPRTGVVGSYGTFEIDAAGLWSYKASSAHDAFAGGTTYSDTFSVSNIDGVTTSVTVRIVGANDAAILTGGGAILTETNAPLTAAGVLSISDVDSPATFVAQAGTVGTYGVFQVDQAGVWSYVTSSAHDDLVAGTVYSDTFSVSSADGTTTSVIVRIIGTDDSTKLSGEVVNLTESDSVLTAGGALTIGDMDTDATVVAQAGTVGAYGTFAIDAAGAWSYRTSTAHDAFVAGVTYIDTFRVDATDGTSTSVTMRILGTNDVALLSVGLVTLTETDAVQTTGGILTISDIDGPAAFVSQAATAGAYGTFTINAAGAWSYTTNAAHDAFAAGATYSDTFAVSSADGTTTSVTIQIAGTNDAAQVSAGAVSLTEADAVLSAGGALAVSDVDSPATFVAQAATAGLYGTFTINGAGAWTYVTSSAHDAFAAGVTYTDTFSVVTADGTSTSVTVGILGTNDAAVLSSGFASLTETDAPLTASGKLSLFDVDVGDAYVAQAGTVGTYGTFRIDALGNWTYTTDSAHDELVGGRMYGETFSVRSLDGTTTSVTISLAGSNDAALIVPAAATLSEADSVLTTGGNLAIDDPDSPATFVVQAGTVGTYGTFTIDAAGGWSYVTLAAYDAFADGTTHSDTFSVSSADGTTSSVTIDIVGTNDPAILSAGVATLTETDSVLTAGGTLTIGDVDSAATFVAQAGTVGSYGTFTIDAAGAWSYATATAHNAFVAGMTYSDTFAIASADGTMTSVTIHIAGTNDAAALSAGAVSLTETNAALAAGGTVAASDVDSPMTFVAQSGTAGSYGTFEIDSTGTWHYVASSAHDAFVGGVTYSDTFSVRTADGTMTSVTVDIAGTNDAAMVSSAVAFLTESDAVLFTNGTLAISDVDSPATFVAQAATAGTYGTFKIDAFGGWSYVASSAHDAFLAGVTYSDTFSVSSADGTVTSVTVNILGTNDGTLLPPASVVLTEDNTVLTASGILTIGDVDSPATFVPQGGVGGLYGTFSINSAGAWSYAASSSHDEFAHGVTYDDVFVVSSADGTLTSVTIHIVGTNDAAILSPGLVTLSETNGILTTTGTLAIWDVDSPELFVVQAGTAGTYGTFSIDQGGNWSFAANAAHDAFVKGATYSDTFVVSSIDGTTTSVTVRITGTNDAAVLSSGLASLSETNAVLSTGGMLTISDIDGPATFVAQAATAGLYGALTIDTAGAWSYTTSSAHDAFVAGTTYTDTFVVTSADGTATSVTVNILGTNDPAVLSTGLASLTEADAPLLAIGTLAISDVDSLEVFVDQATTGLYGAFTINRLGSWSYKASSAHNDFLGGTTYTDTFVVSSVDGTTTSVTVTILGTNDAAVLSAGFASLTETNAVLSASGALTIGDIDSPATFVAQAGTVGLYGTFTINAAGGWSYATSSAHDEFAAGVTYTDTFAVSSADGTMTSVTIEIAGINDAAVLSSGLVNLTETNAVLSATGTLTISDVDSLETFVAQVGAAGLYGSFTINTAGAWSYTASSAHDAFVGGTTYTDIFVVTSADGTTTSVTVHMLGTNDAAVLSSGVANLTETNAALSTSGTLTISDVDSAVTFVAQADTAGLYGSFSINAAGAWGYTASSAHNAFVGGTIYTDTFGVTSADGTATSVTIRITGTNDPAVLSSALVNLTETNEVLSTSGTLTISDVDSAATFVAQAGTAGLYGSFSINAAGAWGYTASSAHNAFVGGTIYTDTFGVISADGTATSVTINIEGTNDPAVLSSGLVNLTETDAVLSVYGTLAISDVDSSATFVAQAGTAGLYGTFTIDAAGAWGYTANSAHSAFVGGTIYTDTFVVTSADGTATSVTINIEGTNDPAVLSSVLVNLTETNAVLSTSGALTISDVDSAATFVTQAGTAGLYGSFSIDAAGAWSYTANSAHDAFVGGTLYTDMFVVTSADGTTTSVTINIAGTNDPAVLSSTLANLTETNAVLSANGALMISDVDSAATFVTQAGTAGLYGSFSIDAAGAWSYTASSAHDAFVSGTTYTDTFGVASADGTTTSVTINIAGTNDPAVLSSALANLSETNAVLSTSGTLTISDVDSAATFVAQAGTAGLYGSFSINAAGAWSYTTSSAHNAFVGGTLYADTFSVTSADGTTTSVTINIAGTNDPAVLSSALVNLTETNAVLSTSGTLTISDVDSAATFVAQAGTAGLYGSFSINSAGAWSYTASSAHNAFVGGTIYTDTFGVASADGTTTSVTINIAGTNDPAVLSSGLANLTETNAALSTSGTLTISDVDSAATFVAQAGTAGLYGSFSINAAGAWSYTTSSAHNAFVGGTIYTDTFVLTSADGTATSVTINIAGTNDPAVLSSGLVNLAETNAALSTSGTLTISDVDSAATFVAQAGTAGLYGSFSINAAGAWSYTTSSAHDAFVGGTLYTDTFGVTSADGTATSVTIRITGTNDAAVLSSGLVNLTETNAVLSTSGTLTISDVDSAATFVAQAGTAGLYGSFSINAAGAWSYTASSAHNAFIGGTLYTDTFGVTSADGTATSVTIRITGTNDAAVLSSGLVNLTETNAVLSTSGTLTISDVDSAATFVAQAGTAGLYGSFSINAAGAWSYTASSAHNAFVGGTLYSDTFGVTSADGTATSVTIRITGTNDPAVLSSGLANLTETNAVLSASGTLTISDVDSAATFVAQAGTAGLYGSFSINAAGAWSYTTSSAHNEFVDGTTYTDTFAVASADGTTTSVRVNIIGTNELEIVGAFRLADGPVWTSGPPVYSAKEAAALLMGGPISAYSISVSSSRDPSTITHSAWYDGHGGPLSVEGENLHADFGILGYTSGDRSAYVSDNTGFSLLATYGYTNYVWKYVSLLSGGSGADTISGTSGSDKIVGGGGGDVLTGGAGNDYFYLASPSDGVDTIVDFSNAEDLIVIDHLGFGGNIQPGQLHDDRVSSSSIFVSGANISGAFVNSSQRLFFDTDDHALWYDPDGSGSGSARQILLVGASVVLTHNDLMIL